MIMPPSALVVLSLFLSSQSCHAFQGGASSSSSSSKSPPPSSQQQQTKLHSVTTAPRPTNNALVDAFYFLKQHSSAPAKQQHVSASLPVSGGQDTIQELSLAEFAKVLDEKLYESEWFVNGNVDEELFHEDFVYQQNDPAMIQMNSLQDYVDMLQTLFDSKSRAQVICTEATEEDKKISCTWRLSGKMNILWGFDLKPVLVTTDFYISDDGRIERQVDQFSVPHWDIFVSALFPVLDTWGVTAPPAEPVADRITTLVPAQNQKVAPVDAWLARAGIMSYFLSPPTSLVDGYAQAQGFKGTHAVEDFKGTHAVEDFKGTHEVPSRPTYHLKGTRAVPDDYDYDAEQRNKHAPQQSSNSVGTRQITREEAERMMKRAEESPLQALLDFFDQHATNSKKGNNDPEIRAILADGTELPAIRSPTWYVS